MSSTSYKIKLFVNLGLMYLLLSGCISEETKVKNRNSDIKEVINSYDTIRTKEGIQYNYEFFKKSENEEVRLFNEVISDIFENWDNRYLRDKLDSLIKLDSTRHFPELMMQQIYLYYAMIELKYHHPKAAYQLNLKSLDYVKNYPDLFSNQIKINHKTKLRITKSLSNSPEYTYKKLLNEYQQDPDKKAKQYGTLYNLAIYASETKRYSKSNEYLTQFFKEFPNPKSNILFPDALSLLAWNYAALNQYDSLKITDDKALKFYQNKEFDEVAYNNFLCHTLVTNYFILDERQTLNRINKLLNFYEKSCEKSYSLTLILEAKSKLYEHLKNLEKEKASLMKELDFIEFCPDLDDYGLHEKNRIYLRLFKIASQQNDPQTMRKWYAKLNALDSMEVNYKNEFVKFSQYLSQRDLQLSKQNFKKYKEDFKNQKEINKLYSLLIVLFVILAIYLIILYRENLKNQLKIKEKNMEFQKQNRTISKKNKKLQQFIDSLEDSNRDLKNFAQVAAHDIKSPISTIKAGIGFLKEYHESEIEEDHLQYFDNLEESTQEMVDMINDLLNQKQKS